MESPPTETPIVETPMERKRRLRRERILNNSESRMRRILGEKPLNDDSAADERSVHATTAIVVSPTTNAVSPTTDAVSPTTTAVSPTTTAVSPTGNDVSSKANGVSPTSSGDLLNDVSALAVNGTIDDSTPPSLSKELYVEHNGFHSQVRDATSGDSNSDPQPISGEGEILIERERGTKTLEGGGFGFDASKLKKRRTGQAKERSADDSSNRSDVPERNTEAGEARNETVEGVWAKDSLAAEEEELRRAQNLLLRDHRPSSFDVDGNSNRNSLNTVQPLIAREQPSRTKKIGKRSSQEDVLREELERIMRHENSSQSKPAKPSSRQAHSARRKPAASSQWYTKAWFRISFAILLALFVRVLIQINLSDHFSDSAFYPFFSMELCFFAAAFCSKPPGYRIPIGGGIVEMVTNLLGFSREILGNLKWFYEFAFQKPVEEFTLYFFVFAVSHLILKHVQDREDFTHDEL